MICHNANCKSCYLKISKNGSTEKGFVKGVQLESLIGSALVLPQCPVSDSVITKNIQQENVSLTVY